MNERRIKKIKTIINKLISFNQFSEISCFDDVELSLKSDSPKTRNLIKALIFEIYKLHKNNIKLQSKYLSECIKTKAYRDEIINMKERQERFNVKTDIDTMTSEEAIAEHDRIHKNIESIRNRKTNNIQNGS